MPMPGILSVIDTRISSLLPEWKTLQQSYLSAHGQYWQGLWNHSTIPANGEEVSPDKMNSSPHYQSETWETMGWKSVGKPRTRIKVDQYISPAGPGWTATFQISISGVVWERTILGAGPETSRESNWAEVAASL